MKKLLSLAFAAALILGVFSGCKSNKIVIGASPTPHAEILREAAKILEKEGYEIEIKEFSDYVQPNLALDSKDLTANYFQHLPYLEDFNEENGTDLVSAGAIHYEPFGLYPGKAKSLDAIGNGATIAIPNDTTNEARALLLLEAEGFIKLKADAGLKATVNDITENPKKLVVKELEAAQLVRSLPDVEAAVINGNFALQGGLNAGQDALATEDAESLGGSTFGNIIAVRKGDEDSELIKALVDALKSDEVKTFIEEKYKGAVVPLF